MSASVGSSRLLCASSMRFTDPTEEWGPLPVRVATPKDEASKPLRSPTCEDLRFSSTHHSATARGTVVPHAAHDDRHAGHRGGARPLTELVLDVVECHATGLPDMVSIQPSRRAVWVPTSLDSGTETPVSSTMASNVSSILWCSLTAAAAPVSAWSRSSGCHACPVTAPAGTRRVPERGPGRAHPIFSPSRGRLSPVVPGVYEILRLVGCPPDLDRRRAGRGLVDRRAFDAGGEIVENGSSVCGALRTVAIGPPLLLVHHKRPSSRATSRGKALTRTMVHPDALLRRWEPASS